MIFIHDLKIVSNLIFCDILVIGDNVIETIEIIIDNGPQKLLNSIIVYPQKICYINNKKYSVTDDFLKDVVRTIRLWKNEYGNISNVIDSEEFTITVKTKEKEEKFHGKGIFPKNYNYLKELLGDLYE